MSFLQASAVDLIDQLEETKTPPTQSTEIQLRFQDHKTNIKVLEAIAENPFHEDYFEANYHLFAHGVSALEDLDHYRSTPLGERLKAIALKRDHPKQVKAAALFGDEYLYKIAQDETHPLQVKAVFKIEKLFPVLKMRPVLEKVAYDSKHPKQARAAAQLIRDADFEFPVNVEKKESALTILRKIFENSSHPQRGLAARTLKFHGTSDDQKLVLIYLTSVLKYFAHPSLYKTTRVFFSFDSSEEDKALARPALRHLAQHSTTYTKERAGSTLLREGNEEDETIGRTALVAIVQNKLNVEWLNAFRELANNKYLQFNTKEKPLIHSVLKEVVADKNHIFNARAATYLQKWNLSEEGDSIEKE
ncbi:MAG: hypothetical protein ACTHJ4_02365 [Candidatus Nucleicultricaceae bacterium]